ncbi:MAG: hypothetical protein VX656_17205 [Candidatus Latescibacterota bacterium]|nr:hypothetical protein [Candidatus Latescibacterota bacterium]
MDKAPQMAIVTLGILAVTIPATAQDTVPVDYFVDVLLDEPFPTTIESGRPILLEEPSTIDVLGGTATFDEIDPGVYEIPLQALNSFWGGKLSMLELYLMGLVGPEQVPEHMVLQDWEIQSFDGETLLMTGNLDTVSVADIIEAEGRRAPSHEQAQRHFRMATIVVSPKLLSPVEMTWFDRQAVFVGSDIDHNLAFPAATGYRATLDTRLDVGATAVLESAGETPDDFDLVTNYPNPFNSTTTITFAFESQQRVSLAIYDVVGRRVRTLV